jgi:hypothetical protein
VSWENQVLFSKRKEGRFPRPGEVEDALKQRLQDGAGQR